MTRTEQLIRVHGTMTALLLYHNAEPEARISREQWQEAFDDLAEQARRLEAIIADEEAASKVLTDECGGAHSDRDLPSITAPRGHKP